MGFANRLGTCTVSLGFRQHHDLEHKLRVAAEVGHKAIDIFEDDWLVYLSKQPGYDAEDPWAPTPAHLDAARRIGSLCKTLDLEVVCLQPLIDVEGLIDPERRKWAEKRVKSSFPFLRAMGTPCVFMTSFRGNKDVATSDKARIAADLALFGQWARDFAASDGGDQLYIGFEALSWGTHVNKWKDSWDVVKLANDPNVGVVFDTFNLLAVEYAAPYNPKGHGRIYDTEEESLAVIRESLKELAATVDPSKILVVQVADAERIDPGIFKLPEDPTIPPILPWSRGHRLFPCEPERGGYLPVGEALAAILATGYKGPLTIEVFNNSLFAEDPAIVEAHARRALTGMQRVMAEEVDRLVPDYIAARKARSSQES